MYSNKRKLKKKYSSRHLRRLVNIDTNLFVDVAENDPSSDSSDNKPSTSSEQANVFPNSEQHQACSIDQPDNISDNINVHLSSEDSSSHVYSDFSYNTSSDEDFEATNVDETRSEKFSGPSNFKEDLLEWAVKFNIPQNAFSSLLKTLNKHTNFNLPSDARTLLQTPRQIQIYELGNGLYYHFGLDKVLSLICHEYDSHRINVSIINLILNVDGLPISKSSPACFWPILCSDTELGHVYMVGVYYGQEKPKSANEFLQRFVDEVTPLVGNGFLHGIKSFDIKLHALVCDTPAKSFVLSVKGHSGFSSCPKCTVHGDFLNGRVCFPDTSSATPRTHESFVLQSDEDYHNGETIFLNVPNFDLVDDIPSDYMHLICLGVVKKIITLLIKGPLNVRISSAQIAHISLALETLKDSVPSDFVRKPRTLQWWRQWKATEFRQFLLYLGPLVLKNVLRSDIYLNFLTLHVSTTILSSAKLLSIQGNLEYADSLLHHFVQSFGVIYGKEFISHNVHSLLHLAKDVKKYGPLDKFSAFGFENYMTVIKKKLRKNEKPLQQLAKRNEELYNLGLVNKSVPPRIFQNLEKKHEDGPVLSNLEHDAQYKVLKNQNFSFNCQDEKNNCCLLKDGTVVLISNFVISNGIVYIVGKSHSTMIDLYSAPCQSSLFHINIVTFENSFKVWQLKDIEGKMWKIPYSGPIGKSFLVLPIIHSREVL